MVIHKCDHCEYETISKQALQRHLSKQNKCKDAEYHCKKCGHPFHSRPPLYTHQKACMGPVQSAQEKLNDAEVQLKDLSDKLAAQLAKEEARENEIVQDILPTLKVPRDRPEWMKPLDKVPPKTIMDVDSRRPQVYFLLPGDLLKPFKEILGFPMKLGSTDNPYTRIMSQHRSDFGDARVIDSLVCTNPSAVESELKRWLNMQNRFVACKTPKKKTTETEVIVVEDHADYEKIYRKAVFFAEEYDQKSVAKDEMKSSFEEMASAINALRQQVAGLSSQEI